MTGAGPSPASAPGLRPGIPLTPTPKPRTVLGTPARRWGQGPRSPEPRPLFPYQSLDPDLTGGYAVLPGGGFLLNVKAGAAGPAAINVATDWPLTLAR